MKGIVSQHHMVTARDLAEALAWKSQAGAELIPFAGGTDLMVMLEAGKLKPGRFLNLNGLRELAAIAVSDETVSIGALCTYATIARHPVIRAEFPNLVEAATLTGATAIQNRGTLGGNIANASPAADSPPALLSYGASIELASTRGHRRLPYDGFHLGYKQTQSMADELLTAVILPRASTRVSHHYRKVGTRRAQAISKVVFAGATQWQDRRCHKARLAFGSMGPITLRLHDAEAALEGQELTPALIDSAVTAAERALAPIDDIRSTAAYRLTVACNVLRSCLGAWAQDKDR